MISSYWKCFWSIWRHKWYVYRGSHLVGGVPWHRTLMHDMVKFHPKEFFGYANKFYGKDDDPGLFTMAWLHHQNHCDHHPDYWIPRGTHKKHPGMQLEPLPMPEVCVREMVSDWVGANIVYSNSTDMTPWLDKNLDKLNLHPDTRKMVLAILSKLGYHYDY